MKILRGTIVLLCALALLARDRRITDAAVVLATAVWAWSLASNPHKYSRMLPAGVAVGLVFMLCGIFVEMRGATPKNDFLSFYVGAQSVGSYDFYTRAAASSRQQSLQQNQFPVPFVRLPFYAWLLRPLTKLTYRTAYIAWQSLSVASFLVVAPLWFRQYPAIALACAWSVPIAVTIIRGQDAGFVVVLLSLALLLMKKDRLIAAGILLALCTIKWNLFLLLPLFLVRFRSRRFLSGFIGAIVILLLLSFAVAGRHWPGAYFALLQDPQVSPHVAEMPNLRGLLSGWSQPVLTQGLLVLAVIGLALIVVARSHSREYAMAATCVAGILLTPHAYLYDCVLLVPLLVAVSYETEFVLLRYLAILALTPTFALPLASRTWHIVSQSCLIVLLMLMAWENWKQPATDLRSSGSVR